MDYHKQLGTNISIVKALKADIIEDSIENCNENEFVVCNIANTNTDQLIERLIELFEIPYVDFEGQKLNDIQKIAIVAGCGDKVQWMKDAEKLGAQAYITGEIHCHIDNEYGLRKYKEMKEYVSETSMSLIGVSHSASEYLVKKTIIKDWIESIFDVKTVLIPQEKWWL